jgi:hypothetical protein
MHRAVSSALQKHGLLLLTDAKFPSVAAIIAGEPVRGSWWSHPSGREIFAVAGDLEDDPAVLTLKLISGKVTFVHLALRRAVFTVASSGEAWQLSGLSPAARTLLRKVRDEGSVQTGSAAARELEGRLLVHGAEIHTESGAHAKVLESWEAWAKRARPGRRTNVDVARHELEARVALLNAQSGATAKLPWQ